ncbi:restriction endonuclease [Pseudomonas rustica]
MTTADSIILTEELKAQMEKSTDWYVFQEAIAEHFRSLGAVASTNVTIEGVRTKHEVDVLVLTKFLGSDIKWIVEAKAWNSKVPKEKVFALRTIVEDVGADKGFLISHKGFQSGAIESATKSNIELLTFEDLKHRTRKLVQAEMLNAYEKRADQLAIRYFSHPKRIRIKYGLRDDIDNMELRFSGQLFIGFIFATIEKAKHNNYPMSVQSLLKVRAGENTVESFIELINWLNINLNMFDEMLLKAEYEMIKNKEFQPDLEDIDSPEYKQHVDIMRQMYKAIGKGVILDFEE